MIQWFNSNQGFVISLLTAIYVIATIIVLIMMERANAIASRAIQHSQDLHHQQTRPYVVFDLVCRDRCIYAELQNFGRLPAFAVRVSLTPNLCALGKDRTSSLLEHTIGMLAPGRVIEDFIDVGHQFHQSNPLQFQATVYYADAQGKPYSDVFSLDLAYYVQVMEVGRKDPAVELEKIAKELQNINKSLSAIAHKN